MQTSARSWGWPQVLKYAAFAILLIVGLALARSDDGQMLGFAVIIVGGWELIAWSTRKERARKAMAALALQQQDADNAANLGKWKTEPMTPVPAGNLILDKGEICYWAGPASVYAIMTSTSRQGGYAGVSVPTASRAFAFAPAASRPIP